ncbi:CHAT domain-containing protein [Pseudanabaena sp. UWO310]|uniref:CHAT domain-containing protein n=1 Tax=Pseudanabaena sp. UWO310 TaxID=2480795 RepID=UPI00115819F1|nr:CHAT domain-containing protein [Pseudanabaena sp. UWO310]TYQ31346.1 CHAT domain-containing protein [Pseudanabaena sp. UWO310]
MSYSKPKSSKLLRYLIMGLCAAIITILLGWNVQPSQTQNISKDIPKDIPKNITKDIPKPSGQDSLNVSGISISQSNPVAIVDIGKQYYQSGQYAQAIATWQQAADIYAKQGDRLNQAVVSQNLALAHQQLGHWQESEQSILLSLEIFQSHLPQPKLLAQALNIQGSIQIAQGKAQEALATWQRAAVIYEQIGDKDGAIRNKINQSQAMRSLGLYPKAKDLLNQVQSALQELPASSLKLASLIELGDTLRLNGDFAEATTILKESLAIAQKLNDKPTIAEIFLGLGNVNSSQLEATSAGDSRERQQKSTEAIAYYQQAAQITTRPITQVKAQINQLRLEIGLKQFETVKRLLPTIQAQLQDLPPSRASVYARVGFAQDLMKLNSGASDRQIAAQLLAKAAQQSQAMGDPRAESYAIGYLGELYERSQQFTEAQGLTEKALILAQNHNAADIAYRWQWQLGRIFKAQGKQSQAIAAYNETVSTLTSIRGDLVSSNADIQFSFRDGVEPIYRQLVDLLMTHEKGQALSQENLIAARKAIESLQIAELDNFFKEACLKGLSTQVDEVDAHAAVIYPIVLPDRVEVIVSLPDRSLIHRTTTISQDSLNRLLSELWRSLRRTSLETDIQTNSEKTYNILIGKELEAIFTTHKIQTLVFVLDGALRNLPMAVLYDGKQYLMEKYNLAVTPGLQLLDPHPLKRQQLEVFIGGLSKGTQNFSALPNVEREIQQIASLVSAPTPLLNETFISESIKTQISKNSFRVVHLATHGEFSSDAAKTFILTWNNRLGVKQLGDLLQTRDRDQLNPIELLVLSACKTAKGDNRATLGLAGLAVRSGARSTIASLWSVEDSATATFMEKFYQELMLLQTTKANALRKAQIGLLNNPQFTHPFYWAPFVLVGNWL